jgi:hypothetical protein
VVDFLPVEVCDDSEEEEPAIGETTPIALN